MERRSRNSTHLQALQTGQRHGHRAGTDGQVDAEERPLKSKATEPNRVARAAASATKERRFLFSFLFFLRCKSNSGCFVSLLCAVLVRAESRGIQRCRTVVLAVMAVFRLFQLGQVEYQLGYLVEVDAVFMALYFRRKAAMTTWNNQLAFSTRQSRDGDKDIRFFKKKKLGKNPVNQSRNVARLYRTGLSMAERYGNGPRLS